MSTPLRVGQVLYGYCGGYFGRDSYSDKRIEAIGADWVVVRENGRAVFASFEEGDLDRRLGEFTAHQVEWDGK